MEHFRFHLNFAERNSVSLFCYFLWFLIAINHGQLLRKVQIESVSGPSTRCWENRHHKIHSNWFLGLTSMVGVVSRLLLKLRVNDRAPVLQLRCVSIQLQTAESLRITFNGILTISTFTICLFINFFKLNCIYLKQYLHLDEFRVFLVIF